MRLQPWHGSGTSGELLIGYNAPPQGQQVAGWETNSVSQSAPPISMDPCTPDHAAPALAPLKMTHQTNQEGNA